MSVFLIALVRPILLSSPNLILEWDMYKNMLVTSHPWALRMGQSKLWTVVATSVNTYGSSASMEIETIVSWSFSTKIFNPSLFYISTFNSLIITLIPLTFLGASACQFSLPFWFQKRKGLIIKFRACKLVYHVLYCIPWKG